MRRKRAEGKEKPVCPRGIGPDQTGKAGVCKKERKQQKPQTEPLGWQEKEKKSKNEGKVI